MVGEQLHRIGGIGGGLAAPAHARRHEEARSFKGEQLGPEKLHVEHLAS